MLVFPISTRMRKMTLTSRRSEVMMHQIMRVRVARLRADLSIELLENFVSGTPLAWFVVLSVFPEEKIPMIVAQRTIKTGRNAPRRVSRQATVAVERWNMDSKKQEKGTTQRYEYYIPQRGLDMLRKPMQ